MINIKQIKIALAGNPNSGKTTLFNQLTGSTAHVGNWAGVTVERREGKYKYAVKNGEEYANIIDLPGIYSLSPYSPEEKVSRDYIINGSGEQDEQPDIIINVINVMQFERSLYLTTQLLETDRPVIIALNMIDVFEKQSGTVDLQSIEKTLGVPVVSISAINGVNVQELMNRAIKLKGTSITPHTVLQEAPFYGNIRNVKRILEKNNIGNALFYAIKITENKQERNFLGKCNIPPHNIKEIEKEIQIAEIICESDGIDGKSADIAAITADLRYKYICSSAAFFVKSHKTETQTSASERADKIFTHKILGIPVFLCMMFLIFHLTFSQDLFMLGIASPGVAAKMLMTQLIKNITAAILFFCNSLDVSEWLVNLLINGIWTGVSAVFLFIPQILVLFLFLSILEDSGYMARAAFIMDRLLQKIGLSGKSFVPMLMGFGCSVPAVMAARTIENENDRRLTVMLVPFMSCGAKFPIYAMVGASTFTYHGDIVVFGIYLLGVLYAIFSGVLLKKLLFKKGNMPFIMELPDYHLPSARVLWAHLGDKLKGFFIKAGTLITVSAVIIWIMQNFTLDFKSVIPGSTHSMLAVTGGILRPVFAPLGFAQSATGWKNVAAIFAGFAAKEAVVSTLNQLHGGAISDVFTPLSAATFMAFNLLCTPCFAAVGAIRKELESVKLFAFTLCYQFSSAWIVSFLIYNTGKIFFT